MSGLTGYEKVAIIKSAIEVIKADFSESDCGKHGNITLSCIACQAAIVVSWLQEHLDYIEEDLED